MLSLSSSRFGSRPAEHTLQEELTASFLAFHLLHSLFCCWHARVHWLWTVPPVCSPTFYWPFKDVLLFVSHGGEEFRVVRSCSNRMKPTAPSKMGDSSIESLKHKETNCPVQDGGRWIPVRGKEAAHELFIEGSLCVCCGTECPTSTSSTLNSD